MRLLKREVDSLTVRASAKDDGYISIHSFLEMVRETVALLRDMDPDNTLTWKLKSATTNSPLTMTFVAEPNNDDDFAENVSDRCIELLQELEGGTAPDDMPPAAADHAARLANILNNSVADFALSNSTRQEFKPTQRIQATVQEWRLARTVTYSDRTSIEGELRTISVDGGSRFFIRDRVTGFKILCLIPHDKLDKAKAALERRVCVFGVAKYRNDRPRSIEVDDFDVFPESAELPSFSDIQGIDLGGIESVEHTRRLWNDEDSDGLLG